MSTYFASQLKTYREHLWNTDVKNETLTTYDQQSSFKWLAVIQRP